MNAHTTDNSDGSTVAELLDADQLFEQHLGEWPVTLSWAMAKILGDDAVPDTGALKRLMSAFGSATRRGDVEWFMRQEREVFGKDLGTGGSPRVEQDGRYGAVWTLAVWSPKGKFSHRPYIITGVVFLGTDAWGVPQHQAMDRAKACVGSRYKREATLFEGWSVGNLLVSLWETNGAARILEAGLNRGHWADEAREHVPTWTEVSAEWREGVGVFDES
jgi:hypothetical protein